MTSLDRWLTLHPTREWTLEELLDAEAVWMHFRPSIISEWYRYE